MMMPRLSVSGLSILAALVLAVWEWFFFFYAGNLESTFGLLSPNRLGLDLAWIAFFYLSVQLVSIPFAVGASRDRFIGLLDGMASLLPLGISLVVIFGKSELLVTPGRWEAAFLLFGIAATDLFGGYAINIALSRRMMDVAGPVPT
jgi:hypothetical protein